MIDQDDLIVRLKRIKRLLCRSDNYWLHGKKAPKPTACTCIEGIVSRQKITDFRGPATGCPEASFAAEILAELTEEEYERLLKRRRITLQEGVTFPERQKEKE